MFGNTLTNQANFRMQELAERLGLKHPYTFEEFCEASGLQSPITLQKLDELERKLDVQDH